MQCVISVCFIFFFKQKTAYEMRISDWSSDVCSSDLFGSRIRDIHTGDTRELPLPVYVVAPNGSYALSVDYRRLYITHETIGYSEHGGPFQVELCPADDGIRIMDLDTGAYRMLVSYGALKQFHHRASMAKAIHWVSHIEIHPASSRILFMHRWTERVEDKHCFLLPLINLNP